MTLLLLSDFLPDTPRNRENIARYAAAMADLGYTPLTADEFDGTTAPEHTGEPCTRTRCYTVHTGYAGSEHRTAVRCLCGWTGGAYPSHMRPRRNPDGSVKKIPARHKGCPLTGARKAAERAGAYRAAGVALPAWDTDALNATAAEPGDATQATQAAAQTRTAATATAAAGRPAPKPRTQPPKSPTARPARTPQPTGIDMLRELLTLD